MDAAAPIIVLADNPQHPLFSSWLGGMSRPVTGLTHAAIDHAFAPETGLVVTADCYHEPRVTLLRRAVEQGIPTLVLADGILEYRNTWEHPQLPPGSLFQPVLGHKLACLGRSQARVLESWHNAGRCEVTGSPRFDRYAGRQRRRRPAGAPCRILIMTALTPYFTPEHEAKVKRSLADLKAALARKPAPGAAPIEPVWRLTQGLDRELGVAARQAEWAGRDLADVLQEVDAVITTPSTTMLEAMLLGLPVASLDYSNSPPYVTPAWRITAAEHLAPTLAELASPPAPKLLFQDAVLHDALECATPAAPRLQALAEEMIRLGQDARRAGQPLQLPGRMVGGTGPAVAEENFRLAELYPGHPQFAMHDVRALQVEVGHLRHHAAEMERRAAAIRAASLQHAQLAVAWRAPFEAARILRGLGQGAAARQQLLAGVKAVESCQNPPVILEALLAITPELARLDVGRARYLLDVAVQLATGLRNAPARAQAERLLAEISSPVAGVA